MVAEDFDPRQFEDRQLAALEPEHRAAIKESVSDAKTIADRLRETLASVVASLNASLGDGAAELVGLKNRFKTESSLARAFAVEWEAEGTTPADFLAATKDRVRFSIQLREPDYHVNVFAALTKLRSRGHDIKRMVNFWGSGGRHNGLNVSVLDPEGNVYELQFPTGLSRSISDQTHLLYEVLRHDAAPFAAQVDAFLRILAINVREGIAGRQPDGVDDLRGLVTADWKDVDSTFQSWLRKKAVNWAAYLGDLEAEGSSFDRVLARTGLTRADVLETDDDDRHDVRLSGDPEVRYVGRDDQPDRVRGAEQPLVASSDVERAAEGVDLRAGDRGNLPVGPELSGEDPAAQPHGGGEHRSGDPALGTADGTGPSGDARRGATDGLGLRSTPRVTDSHRDGNAPSPASGPANLDHNAPQSSAQVAPSGNVDPLELATAQRAVVEYVAPHSPELADVVVRLLTDHAATDHRLNATEALLDPDRRPRALQLLVELSRTAVISHYGSLDAFLANNPGVGSLFDPVAGDINTTPDGASRMKVFEAAARRRDPVRGVGPNPTPAELTLLDDYGIRLRRRVLPAAKREIEALADLLGGQVQVSARAKKVDDLHNKVQRMTSDRPNRPARPGYRIGDVIDAVGVRLTVPDMATLEIALGMVKERFGDRILEIENMYAEPKSQAPSYRVIPIIISIETDGLPCTYELQLTTQRASIAADIEHNTIYKPYVSIDEMQEAAVKDAMREAAALDQLESVERENDGR